MTNRFKYYPGAIELIVKTDPRASALVEAKAVEVMEAAKLDFDRQQRHDNEWRLSETTPPKYIESFGVREVENPDGVSFQAYNDDPAAHLVEYGAHAGGRTPVLRYHPLLHGLEEVGGTQ